jgi:hypothetical protein
LRRSLFIEENQPSLPHSRLTLATSTGSTDPRHDPQRYETARSTTMVQDLLAKPPIRFITDALIGLVVFTSATIAVLGPSAAAQLIQVDGVFATTAHASTISTLLTTAVPAVAMSTPPLALRHWTSATDPQTIMILLALVFSTLFAVNLAFVRHLRQAHAIKPRATAHQQLTSPPTGSHTRQS